jgi:hypothetical protein
MSDRLALPTRERVAEAAANGARHDKTVDIECDDQLT